MGGCERCSGLKVKCSGIHSKQKGLASVVEVPRKTRETRSSGSGDGVRVEKELLEGVKGMRAEMKAMAGSLDRMTGSFERAVGMISEWWKRESHIVDFE